MLSSTYFNAIFIAIFLHKSSVNPQGTNLWWKALTGICIVSVASEFQGLKLYHSGLLTKNINLCFALHNVLFVHFSVMRPLFLSSLEMDLINVLFCLALGPTRNKKPIEFSNCPRTTLSSYSFLALQFLCKSDRFQGNITCWKYHHIT